MSTGPLLEEGEGEKTTPGPALFTVGETVRMPSKADVRVRILGQTFFVNATVGLFWLVGGTFMANALGNNQTAQTVCVSLFAAFAAIFYGLMVPLRNMDLISVVPYALWVVCMILFWGALLALWRSAQRSLHTLLLVFMAQDAAMVTYCAVSPRFVSTLMSALLTANATITVVWLMSDPCGSSGWQATLLVAIIGLAVAAYKAFLVRRAEAHAYLMTRSDSITACLDLYTEPLLMILGCARLN